MKNGQFQVYTGNGKGKTTAAIGLAVRASGAGLRVFFGQFIKDDAYSEIGVLKSLAGVTVEQFGTGEGHPREDAPRRKRTGHARARGSIGFGRRWRPGNMTL